MNKVVAVIRVRMDSERFPGKPMKEVLGKPLLGHLIDRVKRSTRLDDIVIAASEFPSNDRIEEYCKSKKIKCFRGSEEDVLGRMIGALESVNADIGVEIYGDSFLADPEIIDECIQEYLKDPSYDFVGNDVILTYPSGLLVEVFSLKALKDSASRTDDPEMREHGTRFLRLHPDLYKIKNIEAKNELHRPELHLDVDTPEDLEVIKAIFEHFKPQTDFTALEVIEFLDANPKIKALNQDVHRRWKESIDKTTELHKNKTND